MTPNRRCIVCGCSKVAFLSTRNSGFTLRKTQSWLCSVSCLNSHLNSRIAYAGVQGFTTTAPRQLSLGAALVRRGLISQTQLKQAVTAQCRAGGKLLRYLVSECGVSETDIAATVAEQWSVPFTDINIDLLPRTAPQIVPLELLRRSEGMVVHADQSRGTLHLAFGNRPDHALSLAVEMVTGLDVVTCIARHSTVRQWLNRQTSHSETLLPRCTDIDEASSMLSAYVAQRPGCTLAVASLGATAWMRVSHDQVFDVICDIRPETDKWAFSHAYATSSADSLAIG